MEVGSRVEKGDPMGYFLFGGSDIAMVFQDCVDVELLCEAEGDGYSHILMGEPYANLNGTERMSAKVINENLLKSSMKTCQSHQSRL